jgi:hypothetical protein
MAYGPYVELYGLYQKILKNRVEKEITWLLNFLLIWSTPPLIKVPPQQPPSTFGTSHVSPYQTLVAASIPEVIREIKGLRHSREDEDWARDWDRSNTKCLNQLCLLHPYWFDNSYYNDLCFCFLYIYCFILFCHERLSIFVLRG